jgi:hypothetical protein
VTLELGELAQTGIDEILARPREGVHRHLALPARADEPLRTQRAHVMGDEILASLRDPRGIANAELAAVAKGERKSESRGIAERAKAPGDLVGSAWLGARPPQRISSPAVDVEKLAALRA